MDIFQDYKTAINLQGIAKISANAGQTQSHSWTADNEYHLTGIDYCVENHACGITATLELYHPLDLVNPIYTFGKDVYIFDKHSYQFYTSQLQTGLIIKTTIKNNSSNDINFYYNFILHIMR